MDIRCGWSMREQEQDRQKVFSRARGFRLWTVGIQVSGCSRIKVGTRDFIFEGANCVLVEPDVAYRVSHGGGDAVWEEGWAFFTPRESWEPYLRWPELVKGYMRIPLTDKAELPTLVSVFRELYAMSLRDCPLRLEFCANLLERFFLLVHLGDHTASHPRRDPRIAEAMALLEQSYELPLAVEDIAERVHMSVSHLAHLFRRQVGMSPIMFRDRVRIRHARSLLLSTTKSVTEIAAAVGYDNPCHFSSRFRSVAGMSPTQYRTTGMPASA